MANSTAQEYRIFTFETAAGIPSPSHRRATRPGNHIQVPKNFHHWGILVEAVPDPSNSGGMCFELDVTETGGVKVLKRSRHDREKAEVANGPVPSYVESKQLTKLDDAAIELIGMKPFPALLCFKLLECQGLCANSQKQQKISAATTAACANTDSFTETARPL